MPQVPASPNPIQQESVQTTSPISEFLMSLIGGNINYFLAKVMPVGATIDAFLTEAQFQAQTSTDWVLCNGRSVVGSQFQIITGNSNIPDCRGRYSRMKDNGAGIDPHGDLALGSAYADQAHLDNHFHTMTHFLGYPFSGSSVGPVYTNTGAGPSQDFNTTATGNSSGGNLEPATETNPKTIVKNTFIRIN